MVAGQLFRRSLFNLPHYAIEPNSIKTLRVDTHAHGFKELAAHVKEFTPEWAATITKLPAAQIRETARAMGAAKPAVAVHPGRHVTWYGDDTQRARAMAILTALLGSWGRKGGIFLPTAVPQGQLRPARLPRLRARPGRRRRRRSYPLASEETGRHERPRRRDAHRQALPDQGLDRLRRRTCSRASRSRSGR